MVWDTTFRWTAIMVGSLILIVVLALNVAGGAYHNVDIHGPSMTASMFHRAPRIGYDAAG
jgi:hypothetical protein